MIYQDSTARARNIADFSPNSSVFARLFESNKIRAFLDFWLAEYAQIIKKVTSCEQ